MLQRRGEIVTREELRSLLWPEDTYVDFEHGLNTAVKKLRHTLGDSAKEPRFVETVPRVGYRFIAAVEEVGEAPMRTTAVHEQRVASNALPRKATDWLPWLVVLLMACGLATAVWFAAHPSRPAPLYARPLTAYPGRELEPALSPNGSRVAFSWDGQDETNFDIYVKSIGPGDPLRLTLHPSRDFSPAWSPDGGSIAFLRELSAGKAMIILVPSLGGGEKEIGQVSGLAHGFFPPPGMTGPYLAWSHDGDDLIVSDQPSSVEPVSLFVLPVRKAGQRRRLTTPPRGSRGDSAPALSPDGRMLAFTRFSGPGVSHLYLLPLGAGLVSKQAPRRLTPERTTMVHTPAWTPDGKKIVFAAGSVTQGGLWRVAVSGFSEPAPVMAQSANVQYPAISRAKERLVWVRSSLRADIYRIQLPSPRGLPAPARRLISSTHFDSEPSYSPDGRRIAFASDRSGSPQIWVCDSEGRHPVQMTSLGGPFTAAPRWSPNGRLIAFDCRAEGQSQIYVMDLKGGTSRRITSSPSSNWAPSWSRDGKWIYFSSDRAGHTRLWKVSVEGGSPIQVTPGDGMNAVESADGECLYYARSSSPWSVWRIPLTGGEEHLVIPALAWPGGYALARERVYFVSPPTNRAAARISCLDLATGGVETLAGIRGRAWGLAVCPDGQSILYSEIVRQDADLMWADGFR